MSKQAAPVSFVVTANELTEGGIVYLSEVPDGASWTPRIAEAALAADTARRDALLALAATEAARNVVVGPYAVEVIATAAGLVHTSTKERIRASGPTVGNSLKHAAAA